MNDQPSYKKVGVLMGGPSAEREVSLASGAAVVAGLEEAGYDVIPIDVKSNELLLPEELDAVFIALHGDFGEDGQVQALLDARGVPYTGPGARASRLAFDKKTTKELLIREGIPTAEFEMLRAGAARTLPLPVVTKPPLQGSSVGLSRVFEEEQWPAAFDAALKFTELVMVESFVEGRELTVGIVGDTALPIIEIKAPDGYYDYHAKYTKGVTRYIVPAELPEPVAERCRAWALQTYELLGCRGMSRVDFRMTADEKLYVLELNTIPGFTETSLLPKAANAAGMNFSNLCDRILKMAMIN